MTERWAMKNILYTACPTAAKRICYTRRGKSHLSLTLTYIAGVAEGEVCNLKEISSQKEKLLNSYLYKHDKKRRYE